MTLECVSSLASVLQDQRKYSEAEVMNQRALTGYKSMLGLSQACTL